MFVLIQNSTLGKKNSNNKILMLKYLVECFFIIKNHFYFFRNLISGFNYFNVD